MPHLMTVKVRFSDLDPYDHVNHARYFGFFESARIEALEEMGFGMGVLKERGMRIVLVETHARYHRPAGLHDELTITTSVIGATRATASWPPPALRATSPNGPSALGEELKSSPPRRPARADVGGSPAEGREGGRAAAGRRVPSSHPILMFVSGVRHPAVRD